MKKLFIPFSICSLFLSSAYAESTKGNWSNQDIVQLRLELQAERGDLDRSMGADKTNLWIECALQKTESGFENYAAANANLPGMELIGKNCALEVMTDASSVRGGWSFADRQQLRKELEAERASLEETFGKAKTDLFIDCGLRSAEAGYENYVAAGSDLSGMELIGKNCALEVMTDDTSVRGNWSPADKSKARSEVRGGMGDTESTLGRVKTNAIVECIINKAEANYRNLFLADQDFAGMEKVGKDCAVQVMTDPNSRRGKWSYTDKQQLLNEMNAQRGELEPTFGKDKTDLWIQCAVNKTEATFQNYMAANTDLSTMEKIGGDCAIEVMKIP